MPEDQTEKEPKERAVKIGEWFNPLRNYENRPYTYNEKDYKGKVIPFQIDSVGRFTISLIWVVGEYEEVGPSIVVLPFGEEEISDENSSKLEAKFESRLLTYGVGCEEEKYTNQNIPYQVEVRLPSGRTLNNKFEQVPEDTHIITYWINENGAENELLIPEIENILEKIQMRIVPIAENQRLP